MTVRTFIWGSCVSRDTFEFMPDGYELLGYVARQSWISTGKPANAASVGDLPSAFQRRMTEGDADGDALDRIAAVAAKIDLLLLDLCDERLGVVVLPDGGVVTRSVEKIGNGAQKLIDEEGSVCRVGDPEHLDRWLIAAREVRGRLEELGLFSKTLVLAPEWALVDDEANASPTSFGMTAAEMNPRYEVYYAALEDLGFEVLRLGPTLGGSNHKWGRAPFHFHESIYRTLVRSIDEASAKMKGAAIDGQQAARATGSPPLVAGP